MKNIQKLNLNNGLLNVGTGQPKTFVTFARDIMNACNKKGELEFIDMPKNLQNHYQYYTKSENSKTKKVHELMADFNYKKDLIYVAKSVLGKVD
jgi:hypothetical protein